MSILPYLSDTGAMYLEYLTKDTFKSIFPNPGNIKQLAREEEKGNTQIKVIPTHVSDLMNNPVSLLLPLSVSFVHL